MEVTDSETLNSWRKDLVEELMNPQSSYTLVLRERRGGRDRVDFLDGWCELIAETLDRLLQSGARGSIPCSPEAGTNARADTRKTALLILAALHGGGTLSQLAEDPRPLNAALDLAFVPLLQHSKGS
ncbi:hypothetical protein [Pseudarthrobacter sp. W1I19]|uniref:hypothetical protein n=1 Tax=Pseudarthrobacter sp. W1I19 TaxID=3042288 RepID=UPI0027D9122D|nr:hypothetical protein [Pseudarthrobacter sp. W1I19]